MDSRKETPVNVGVKSFDVDMVLKNKGIELAVYATDNTTHLGDLVVTKTQLIWCPGKTGRKNGKKAYWNEFIDWMNS
jgi:hypothetical protein